MGSGATGGTAGKGSTGGAGTGGSTSCASLREKLSGLLSEAQACTRAANAEQCVGFVTSECGCSVPVNNPRSEPARAYTELVARLKKECSAVCTAVLCIRPSSATCSSSGQGAARCVANGLNPGQF